MAVVRQDIPQPLLDRIREIALPHGGKTRLAEIIKTNRTQAGIIADSGKATPSLIKRIQEALAPEAVTKSAA